MSKVTMLHGRAVRPFPQHRAGAQVAKLAESYRGLLSLAERAKAKAAEVAADPNLSDQGRKTAMQAWFKAEALPTLSGGKNAINGADADIFGVKAVMTRFAPDKTDIAGAMVRAQTRDWLRSMPPAARTALLTAPEIDPGITLAIAEAPPALSGVTPAQADRLATAALAALNPNEMATIAGIEEAAVAVADAQRMAMLTVSEAAGLTPDQIEVEMGGKSWSERIRAALEAGNMSADPEDQPSDELNGAA